MALRVPPTLSSLLFAMPVASAFAEDAAGPAPATQPAPPPRVFETRAYGAQRDPDPPAYARPLSLSGLPGTGGLDWLDFGLEHRTRYEYRSGDYRRILLTDDDRYLMRSRAYVGVRHILDPLRFGIEYQDSRQFGSQFPELTFDVNENDILQAFAELYFHDLLGPGQPLRLTAGRMSIDLIDRKFVARARWANATNAFDGFRLQLGDEQSRWYAQFLAAQPVFRQLINLDQPDEERWLYALTGAWRGWQKYVTFEPYYFIQDEDGTAGDRMYRQVHTPGIHVFGPVAGTRFDYDIDAAFQFGRDWIGRRRAFGLSAEVGYTFAHPWSPRVAGSLAYATGDRNPWDNTNERFESPFGSVVWISRSQMFAWSNIINPRLRLEFDPLKNVKIDTSYAGFWLQSDTDAWLPVNRRAPNGDAGNFLGQEVDLRVRWFADRRLEIWTGFIYFIPGPFVGRTGDADDSLILYLQAQLRF